MTSQRMHGRGTKPAPESRTLRAVAVSHARFIPCRNCCYLQLPPSEQTGACLRINVRRGSLMKDIRYALRQFAAAPVFTATVVLTLALGIGATTAIFTLVHAVLLNSLPVANPSELYRVGDVENCCVNGGLQDNWSLFSYDKYKTFRDNTEGFSELAAFQSGFDLIGVRRSGTSAPAQSMHSEYVSGNYFTMFGIGPYSGRVFTPDDDRKGASPVAVISYRAWQQKFGGDRTLVGSSVSMN